MYDQRGRRAVPKIKLPRKWYLCWAIRPEPRQCTATIIIQHIILSPPSRRRCFPFCPCPIPQLLVIKTGVASNKTYKKCFRCRPRCDVVAVHNIRRRARGLVMETAGRVERRSSSRRQHRRVHSCGIFDDRRPTKRLFTPEIKRFLKSWLVRRRDNPYPNRDEKKSLAVQTGLTYVQVCNWFANWRRKLKNAGGEPQRSTWGHLIKAYNSQAQGNVEHFSICSDDSIWEEQQGQATAVDHCYTSTLTEEETEIEEEKYKSNIMEKYLRNLNPPNEENDEEEEDPPENNIDDRPKILSKWLQSAVNFRPRRENYAGWQQRKSRINGKKKKESLVIQHGREELDAAEALTRLACTSASAS